MKMFCITVCFHLSCIKTSQCVHATFASESSSCWPTENAIKLHSSSFHSECHGVWNAETNACILPPQKQGKYFLSFLVQMLHFYQLCNGPIEPTHGL